MGGGRPRGNSGGSAYVPGGGSYIPSGGSREHKKITDYGVDDEEPKVFLSYHYKGDVQKVNLIRHQAETSEKLEFVETSSTERYPKDWKPYAMNDIKRSDEVVVVVGKDTYKSEAVEWEVEKAHENGVPVLAVRTKKNVKIPKIITQNDDKVTDWHLEEIQKEVEKAKKEGDKEERLKG